MTSRPTIRCAIYTRKSSEEGLDQGFNSLDAQHEACAAYVSSQRHEGWRLVPERFDDGGLSGGTMERPALQRLLAEIDAGRISMVVVYKIDRLTRSLADFARLVERLETRNCSFVSVTQAFNTGDSMGRLTLNMLLSFAQFEREVTAERIRDKIAASKRKGLWMGGNVPLGYDRHPDPKTRSLVINEPEAEIVRTLFQLYADLRCLRLVETRAAELGLRSKRRTRPDGMVAGDKPLSRGQIHQVLRNPLYLGRIRHKDRIYPGLHPAIIDEELFADVQARLQAASGRPRRRPEDADIADVVTSTTTAPLVGKLRDETGDRLTPIHSRRRGRKHRYYISHRLIRGGPDPAGWRLPATALESFLAETVAGHIRRVADRHALLRVPVPAEANALQARARGLADRIASDPAQLASLLASASLTTDAVEIELDPQGLTSRLGLSPQDLAPDVLIFSAPMTLRRRGVETRILAGDRAPDPDPVLVQAIARARNWAVEIRTGATLEEIARRANMTALSIRKRLPLAFLSPTIQAAILEGRQPADLSLQAILRRGVPLDWDDQAILLGFGHS